MSDSPDLSALTFDEIVEELKRRCDGLIVVAEIDRTDDEQEVKYAYRGGRSRCLGMSVELHDWIKRGRMPEG
jgi:hypothetical protein